MQQGSVTTPHSVSPATAQQVRSPELTRQQIYVGLKSSAALCRGIEGIAIGCMNDGRFTADHAEDIALLAHNLREQLAQLGIQLHDC